SRQGDRARRPCAFKYRFDDPLILQPFFPGRVRLTTIDYAIGHVIELIRELIALRDLRQRRLFRFGEHFQAAVGERWLYSEGSALSHYSVRVRIVSIETAHAIRQHPAGKTHLPDDGRIYFLEARIAGRAECAREHFHRFFAEQKTNGVNAINAEIADGTAAGKSFAQAPSHFFYPLAVIGFHILYRTKGLFSHHPLHRAIHRFILNAIRDHQFHLRFPAGIDHLLAFH